MMDQGFKNRAFFVCLLLVAGLSALSVKLISLQVWDRQLTDTTTVPRFKLRERIPARCGNIVDRNQTVVAQNRPEAALIADLNHLTAEDILWPAVTHRYASRTAGWKNLGDQEKSERLSEVRRRLKKKLTREDLIEAHLGYAAEVIGPKIRMSSNDLKERVHSGPKRVVVKKGLREDVARTIEEELQARNIQGFSFERSQRRYYPMPTLAPHIWGFRNHQGVAQSGLEKSMDDILSGRDGERILRQDENGLVNLTEPAQVTPPRMGKHLRTTLDMGIQAIVEEELGMAFEAYHAKHGSIIVVEPHTGDILAIASRPHFNLNVRENYHKAGSSFAVSAQYESGSVMKIVAMAAALDQGAVTRETVVDCGWGSIRRYGFILRDHHPYGDLTFDKVLVKSSNTGVFQFAEMVGRAGFYRYLRDFGFGQETGFPIPGEARGRIQETTNMRNFASATYGYGVSVTPLQLAMAYSVLANGGNLLKPRLIDSIIANNGARLDHTPVRRVRRVIREETARQMCLALEKVVLKGTGRRAQVPGYRAGGKTGTAEKWIDAEERYHPEKKFLTFAGFLPVDNPRFVCVVTIDEPSGFDEDFQVGGGTIAAPVFAQVSGRIARFMNLAPTEETVALNPKQ